ncbi:hypothetical protein HZA86_00255 [Candidatus Uhrbacteria bacterium]|nr:hypothetical protein [Candidatus Uhrbacteria bacterium]
MDGRTQRIVWVALLTAGIFATTPLWRLSWNQTPGQKLSGHVLLEDSASGNAWYVNPADAKRYAFQTPGQTFRLIQKLGLGVRHRDIERYRLTLPKKLLGQIVIDTEDKGNAYYVTFDAAVKPLGNPDQAFEVLRSVGEVVSAVELEKIAVGSLELISNF